MVLGLRTQGCGVELGLQGHMEGLSIQGMQSMQGRVELTGL